MNLVNSFALRAALPTVISLLAFTATTVIAALAYAFLPNSTAMMTAIGITLSPEVAAEIGTPFYYSILLLPFVLVPLSAAGAAWTTNRVTSHLFSILPPMNIHRGTLIVMIISSFAFQAFRLYEVGALNLDVFYCGDQLEKLKRRMWLLSNLGYFYFSLAYGSNLILSIIAYLAFIMQGRHRSDLLIFLFSLMGMVYFIAATYSKAPLLVFLLMMAAIVISSRASLLHLVFIGVVSAAVFLTLGATVNASQSCEVVLSDVVEGPELSPAELAIIPVPERRIDSPAQTDVVESAVSAAEPAKVPVPERPIEAPAHIETQPVNGENAHSYLTRLLGMGVVQRMASGVPFYLHLYKTPEERCGVQGLVRRLFGFAPVKCDLSVEVSNAMWPNLAVGGYQPAPAVISAYGELGPLWVIAVMILSGVVLGVAGAVGAMGDTPLFIAFIGAASGFGYFLTQVPFFGALIYPHGLIPFSIPIAILAIAALLTQARHR